MVFIEKNLDFLSTIESRDDWDKLRRRPPCAMPDPHGEARLMTLALKRLRNISSDEREHSRRLRALDPAYRPPQREPIIGS
jgi:hypothetical protein